MTMIVPTRPRRPVYATHTNPGPYYKLSPLLGDKGHDINSLYPKKPAYYIGVKTEPRSRTHTPGPYVLNNPLVYRDGLNTTPKFSMKGRKVDYPPEKTPAPGDYDVIKCTLSGAVYPTQPRCIFGRSVYKGSLDNTPAPNSYTLPSVMTRTVDASKKQSPIYTMRSRFVVDHAFVKYSQTPGPAAYKPTETNLVSRKAPSYTMRPLTCLPVDNTNKPGPGAHRNEIVWDSKKKRAPAFTFGIPHSQYITPFIDCCPEDMH